MSGPVQLNRLMRRYGRVAVVLAAVFAAVTAVATVRAGSISEYEHHAAGHDDAVALCVAIGGCVLAVAGSPVAVRGLLQRSLSQVPAPRTPAQPFVATPALFFSRAGPPPPQLQVFPF